MLFGLGPKTVIEYEAFGQRQRVRVGGRIVGYVLRQPPRRWVAFSATGAYLDHAPRRRDATALLVFGMEADRARQTA